MPEKNYKNMATAGSFIDHSRGHSRDDSATEVGESLLSEEDKQWVDSMDPMDPEHGGSRRHSSGCSRANIVLQTVWQYRWIINMGLLTMAIILLLMLQVEVRRPRPSWQVGGDHDGMGPQFKTKVTHWESDPSFVPPEPTDYLSEKTLARWNTLMPAAGGPIKVNETYFTTSVTHQIHCVYTLGRIYNTVAMGSASTLPSDYHAHFMHCLDYVRQAVMCGADVAIESHEPSVVDDDGPSDAGWNGHHVCKDYGEVVGFLEHQIKDGLRTVLPIDNN